MPRYVDIMNELAAEITTGRYRPETSLPSERELCVRFNTSQKSIRNALSRLQEKGYIYKKRGSGSFVQYDPRRSSIINFGITINYSSNHAAAAVLHNPYLAQTLKGVKRAAAEHSANSSIFFYDETEQIDDTIFTGYKLDGFLNLYFTVNDALNNYLMAHRAKVVSTVTSFQLDRYAQYSFPCVVNDYLSGIGQALQYYLGKGFSRFGFGAIASLGLHNYELCKAVFADHHARIDVQHVAIYPDSCVDMSRFVHERAEYFANIFLGEQMPQVIFSDGDFIVREIIAFLHESERGRDTLGKVRFCTIGVPEALPEPQFLKYIDFIIPQNEEMGRVAATKLVEYIKDGKLPENRYFVPSVFSPFA